MAFSPVLFRFTILCSLLTAGLLLPHTGLAQMGNSSQTDSLDVDEKELRLRRYQETSFWFDTLLTQSPDTLLRGIQWYDPTQRNLGLFQTGGILGSFARPFLYETGPYAPIRLGFRQYELYQFTAEQNEYWQVSKPLTVVDFLTGGTVQQHFRVLHTQNIGENFNLGAEYRLLSSEGFYARQATNNKSLRLFGSFVLPGNRYAAYINYLTNNQLDEQSGGITSGTLFDTTVAFNPLSVPVNLRLASSRHNTRTFQLTSYYRLTGNDSSFSGLTAFHRFRFDREYYRYEDESLLNAGSFYPAIYRDSSITFDTVGIESFSHSLGLRREAPFAGLQWELAAHIQHGVSDLGFGRENFVLARFTGDVRYRLAEQWDNTLRVDVSPYHSTQSSSYAAFFKSKYQFRKISLSFELDSRLQNPDLVSLRYNTNHHRWSQAFGSIGQHSAGLRLEMPVLWAQIRGHQLNNGIFYQANGQPFQFAGDIRVLQLGLGARLKFWKMHLELNHWRQFNDATYLRMPAFASHDVLYFENRFKAGWVIQLGADIRFNSSYTANAFRPETGQFVLQDSLSIGNYPVIDLFGAIKVKRTRLFVRFEHANQGFPRPNVFATPLHPLYGRAFRFGLSWAFYN